MTCMNEACRVTVSSGWKIGWELKSGGFATLCVSCGIAYENSTFCNIFHENEEGWRGCRNCGKRLHCGCPASKMQVEILDLGGVKCRDCVKHKYTNVGASTSNPSRVDVGKMTLANVETATKRKYISDILQTGTGFYAGGSQKPLKTQKPKTSESQASNHHKNNDEVMVPLRKPDMSGSPARFLQYRLWAMSGRGRNQVLNQYRPRTTQQELHQISANLQSTIVPLFEKILSPTDVGRMDRLVLPKHCTEVYFPSVNELELEGREIKIQDVMGVEWTFLLRFWQNNESRMYVLEGFSSFVRNMELQAGDTVTFSRVDPGETLVMGFRKSTSDPAGTSRVQAQCGSSMQTAMIGAIEPPVMEKTAIFTVKPSAWALNDINPKVQAATLNEGEKRGIQKCTSNKDFEPSGLEILATTALLTENIWKPNSD